MDATDTESRPCRATRSNGQPCRSTSLGIDGLCFQHSPIGTASAWRGDVEEPTAGLGDAVVPDHTVLGVVDASPDARTACGAPKLNGDPCGVVVLDPSGKCKHHHGPEMDEWWDSRRKPTTTVAPTRRGGFKQRISAQADDVWDDIESTLHAAIEQATKKQFAKCPHCKKRHEIDVRDWPASLRASEMLLDRVAPKPSTAAGKQAVDGDDFTDMTMERIAAMSYEELRAYRAFTLASDADAIARALDDLDAFDELRAEFGSSGIAEGALRTRARLDDEDMRALYERLNERYGGPREIVA